MIANKHTELRIYDNLNSLLRVSLDEKEYKERINRHITQYFRNYIDEKQYDKGMYDIFDDLGNNYQKHAWNIADKIKDEILEEKKETNWLDPNVYTEEFKESLKENLTDKILVSYFKRLNEQINVYEYRSKINNLKEKEKNKAITDYKEDIKNTIRSEIEDIYRGCINLNNGDSRMIIENFEYVYDVRETIFKNVYNKVVEELNIEVDKQNIRPMFEKELNMFIREKKRYLGISGSNKNESKDTLGSIVKNPELARFILITKFLKDITK